MTDAEMFFETLCTSPQLAACVLNSRWPVFTFLFPLSFLYYEATTLLARSLIYTASQKYWTPTISVT